MKEINQFLNKAARIAKKRGLKLTFKWSDLGDLYHVYGVNATPTQFVDMLARR